MAKATKKTKPDLHRDSNRSSRRFGSLASLSPDRVGPALLLPSSPTDQSDPKLRSRKASAAPPIAAAAQPAPGENEMSTNPTRVTTDIAFRVASVVRVPKVVGKPSSRVIPTAISPAKLEHESPSASPVPFLTQNFSPPPETPLDSPKDIIAVVAPRSRQSPAAPLGPLKLPNRVSPTLHGDSPTMLYSLGGSPAVSRGGSPVLPTFPKTDPFK